ncbi:hypothetical protein AGR13a_Lc120133 [Agrobacterium genomosp. 13 str. CFBP 6927]|uniref:Uncharacterized protein n=1 Tax=Agrobacterium genomosp. 13 str. CFBP 6927 TaxID=1183428 RepID=A0ABM9VKZ7_9HYPH|nr:hypothetical protein AGR13a_Lc120133 [Agrobacterium genomosp. 13 str. CFBP 6927]
MRLNVRKPEAEVLVPITTKSCFSLCRANRMRIGSKMNATCASENFEALIEFFLPIRHHKPKIPAPNGPIYR